MKIVIVEDDYLQAEWLQGILKEHFPHSRLQQIPTELEFRNEVETLRKEPPDLVLLDVMLRWTDPVPDMVPAPEDVRVNGFFRAGFRCEKLLRQFPETENVPVILYTVLEEEDFVKNDFGIDLQKLPPNTLYVSKDSDPTRLLDIIKKVASRPAGA
ncbi:MAG: response regulator transcription factor [Acidobacteria bacterium]|nr:response regulator transcription factor [Acidobacteriota bacterium]